MSNDSYADKFPTNPLASAIFDAYPPTEDLSQWSTKKLRELAVWNVAVLAQNPAVEDVVELTDNPPEVEFPEHGITPENELDNVVNGEFL